MRKIWMICLVLVFISGCGDPQEPIEPMLRLRSQIMQTNCAFDVQITADYGDKTYVFTMACTADARGNVTFAVEAPQTIAGISGKIEHGKGSLTFDDTALAFELLADGQLSPVSAPWVLVSTMRGGYILSCGKAGEYRQVTLHDSYADNALQVDLWLNQDDLPVQAEILYEGRRILTMEVKDFVFS